MKKFLIIFIVILIILIFAISCNVASKSAIKGKSPVEEVAKTYKILTYDFPPELLIEYRKIAERENMTIDELLKAIIDYPERNEITKNMYNNLNKSTYYADEIISYSDKNCRFMEKNLKKEVFISADFIQVEQIY